MSVTVIDRLIVELGLDPRQFQKGTKEAQKATKDTEQSVTKSAGEMIGALRRVAAEFVSLFLVVRSIHDIVGMFSELNESTRQLGIDSKNYGESAAHLRDWGNIAEIAGGKAEDATATMAGLQKAIFDVGHGLGWSPQLTEFGRIGVDTGVATGKMRDFHDLLMDTSKSLQAQFPDRQQRFQETQVLGLKGGIANAVADGPEVLEKYYQQQLKIHQTTEGDTKAAQALAQAWDVLRDKMRALATQILTAVSPAIQRLFNTFGNWLSKHQGDFEKGITGLAEWAQGPGPGKIIDALTSFGDTVVSVAEFIGKALGIHKLTDQELIGNEKPMFSGEFTRAEKKYGLPQGLLSNPDLRGSTMDLDMRSDALSVLHGEAGGDKGDPNWLKAVASFKKQYTDPSLIKKGLWERQTDWVHTWVDPLLAPDATQATQGAGPSPRAQSTIAGAKPTASNLGGAGGSSVHIDNINVNTQATDADGVARDIDGALNRKLTVTQADGALS